MGERAQKPPKRPFHGCCITTKFLKICNLTTSNATLMKLPTILYIHETFNLAETWEVNYMAQKGVNEKPLKMSQKISFLAQFSLILQNRIQTAKCLMHCFVLHHCLKFQTILIKPFLNKPTRSSLKQYFLLVRKLLKDENLHDTCTIQLVASRCTTSQSMYLGIY